MMGRFLDDLLAWSRSDPRMVVRVLELVQSIAHDPKQGIGKPEPLKHDLSGCWSRRVDQEHRLVYEVLPDRIKLLSARYHYSK
ncbi:MAG TPA: Txe/YoeB family addiction module toxin [Longimicrobium sp.]|jgi:toxin YoeB|uniref:Txe/YoeB family addiction module toxin n=1 Tax=Longimicrobium sp. TaxID=2029185 RepID=UPI002ED872A7